MTCVDKDLWLFDYNQGLAYEMFSRCQDYYRLINKFLSVHYDFTDKVILEIGGGSGKFTSFLAEKCSKLYVIEKSESLMQINRKKNCDMKNVQFVLSDVKDLSIEQSNIDIIFAGWSLTSMRGLFDIVFDKFRNVLRKDGLLLIVENAGNDEFCKITNINEFTSKMKNVYIQMGFVPKKIIETTVRLSSRDVFYKAFPKIKGEDLHSLDILHKVLILEMSASIMQNMVSNSDFLK